VVDNHRREFTLALQETMKLIRSLLFAFAAFTMIAQATTTLQVDLDNVALAGTPGGTLQFFATLTNTSLTDTITFSGTSTTAISSLLTIDTSPFILNGPISLAPGEVFPSFEIWDVLIDPTTPSGPYIGNSVSIFGIVDDGMTSNFADVSDPTFDVIVTDAGVPEPATFVLLTVGLCAFALLAKRHGRFVTGSIANQCTGRRSDRISLSS
jgi:hypothetical protein